MNNKNNKEETKENGIANFYGNIFKRKDYEEDNSETSDIRKEQSKKKNARKLSRKSSSSSRSYSDSEENLATKFKALISKEPEYIELTPSEILKEGFLSKRSKFMKKWRSRWTVVTKTHVYTFEKLKDYKNPTETLNLSRNGQYASEVPGHEYGGEFCI